MWCCGVVLVCVLICVCCFLWFFVVCWCWCGYWFGPPSARPPFRRTAQNVALFFPLPPPVSGRWGFTRQPENSKREHVRAPALQTPPNIHEKTPRERKKELQAPHPSGPDFFCVWAPFFGAHMTHTQIEMDWPKLVWPKLAGAKTRWPNIDWPKLALTYGSRRGRLVRTDSRGHGSREHGNKSPELQPRMAPAILDKIRSVPSGAVSFLVTLGCAISKWF